MSVVEDVRSRTTKPEPAVTSEVMEAKQDPQVAPSPELQAQKTATDPENAVATYPPPTAEVAVTELPAIDKRGFLTLLAQHVSRYNSLGQLLA